MLGRPQSRNRYDGKDRSGRTGDGAAMRKWQRCCNLALLGMGAAVLSGCAHQPMIGAANVPGFFSGILHGFIAIFSLIASLFAPVRAYAFPNSGFGYELGFLLGFALCLLVALLALLPRIGGRIS